MGQHQIIANKIKTLPELLQALKLEREKGRSIVFTNGCFDILHKGHVDYLSKAADKGDVLVVAVNADESVKRLGKSPSRPIQDQDARAYLIAALESVSYVFLFFEDTPKEVIDQIVPNVLVKGSDYKAEDIVGYDTVIKNGGKVETIDFIPGYSTSGIEKKILAGH
jgi:rfaE bifunctional protein nucleotidyltransferase chain/domain